MRKMREIIKAFTILLTRSESQAGKCSKNLQEGLKD
jgi:hypothetical protein